MFDLLFGDLGNCFHAVCRCLCTNYGCSLKTECFWPTRCISQTSSFPALALLTGVCSFRSRAWLKICFGDCFGFIFVNIVIFQMARDTDGVLGTKKEKERDIKAEKVAKREQPGMLFVFNNNCLSEWAVVFLP